MGTNTKIIIGIVLAIIAVPAMYFLSAGIFQEWHTYTHRYRLTIEVETPEGAKSSGNVIEVSVQEKPDWGIPATSGVLTRVEGEAVFVDLGDNRHVIATLGFGPLGNLDRAAWVAIEAFAPTQASAQARKPWRDISSWIGSADVTPPAISDVLRPQ